MNTPVNIAILASGSGTNAEAVVKHFANHPFIKVKMAEKPLPSLATSLQLKTTHTAI
jgi:folate-dependent phosphoribosylglycinamide formyltransferase PurN